MRWLVEIPCLALGDKIIQKGDLVPEGVLPQESLDSFVRKGYLKLDEIKVVPVVEIKPELEVEEIPVGPIPEPMVEGVDVKHAPKKRPRKKAKR